MDTLSPNDALNQMVALRLQHAELEAQIETIKPTFLEACAAATANTTLFTLA